MMPNMATADEHHRAECGRYTSGREGDLTQCEHGVIYVFDSYWNAWHALRRPRWYSLPLTRDRYARACAALADPKGEGA